MLKVYTLISLGFCMHLRGHHSQEAGMSITSINCLVPLHSPSLLLLPLPQFSWLALKSGRCSLLCSFSGCSMSLMSFMSIWNIVIIMFSCLQTLTFASVLDYLMTLLLIVSLIFLHLCFAVLVIYWIPDIVSFVLGNAAVWKLFVPFRSCFKTREAPILGAITLECWGKTHLSALSDDLCLRRFSVLPVGMDIVSGSEWIALILPGDSLVTLVVVLRVDWYSADCWRGSFPSLQSSVSVLLFHPVFCPASSCHLVLPGLSALLTT